MALVVLPYVVDFAAVLSVELPFQLCCCYHCSFMSASLPPQYSTIDSMSNTSKIGICLGVAAAAVGAAGVFAAYQCSDGGGMGGHLIVNYHQFSNRIVPVVDPSWPIPTTTLQKRRSYRAMKSSGFPGLDNNSPLQ